MYRISLLILIVALAACSGDVLSHAEDAAPDSVPSILGTYVLNGIDPQGNEYTGFLNIAREDVAGPYQLDWIVTEAFQQGVGELRGNTLEVIWNTAGEDALNASGTATFTVTVEGELYGSKGLTGHEGSWEETAYPSDGKEPREPEY